MLSGVQRYGDFADELNCMVIETGESITINVRRRARTLGFLHSYDCIVTDVGIKVLEAFGSPSTTPQ